MTKRPIAVVFPVMLAVLFATYGLPTGSISAGAKTMGPVASPVAQTDQTDPCTGASAWLDAS